MSKQPFNCKRHGETLAYTHIIKSGDNKGGIRKQCVECRAADCNARYIALKKEILENYGGKCECCGEAESTFLTIDHVDGSGNEHRKQGITGYKLYKWLIKNNCPKENFRILCYNCNCSRGQYGKCAHESKQSKSNAKLIATAPELLDALVACYDAMEYMSEYDIPITLPQQVRGAIAKATK